MLEPEASFADVLNFNYKFRDIESLASHTKQYDNIKIQTQKFQNMQNFSEFLKQITGLNIEAKQINLDTNRLITYGYACLDQNSWNENTDQNLLEKEFEKYCHIKPAGEQIDDITSKKGQIYKEKYLYYGFTNMATMLLTSASNIKNYTSLLFEYENQELYHFLHHLHQKIYLKKLNYQFCQTKDFSKVKHRFLNFAKKNWIYEVTNDEKGILLEKYFKQAQNLDEVFNKLKCEYDLLYKEYQIEKGNRHKNYVTIAIGGLIILNLINILIFLRNK